jgi:chemotaxis protein MotB
LKVHVIGHTDNVPIRASVRSRFTSNWELSTARATAAVRFLSEKAGVNATRLGAVGYGEFRPVADNATPEGRAKNRRIAITLLSEELIGADLVAAPSTNSVAPQPQPPAASSEVETQEESPHSPPIQPAEPVRDSSTPEGG